MPPRKPVYKRKRSAANISTPKKKCHQRHLSCTSIFHRQCAEIVEKILHSDSQRKDGATIKGLTLAPAVQSKKATHAVVCETLRYLNVIKEVMKRSGIEDNIKECMTLASAYVLIYELLIGQGVENEGAAEEKLLLMKEPLQLALEAYMSEKGAKTAKALVSHPENRLLRCARVDTLKLSVQEALSHYSQRWKVTVDKILPDVLKFPPGTELHNDPLVRNGSVILQGYGSCMASHAMAPMKHWSILDACAAPGNKTTHVAALMNNTGQIIALDMQPERFNRLRENVKQSGASHITCKQMDFLTVDPSNEEFSAVDAILLDPSCSGSGTTVSRQDDLLPSFHHGGEDLTRAIDSKRLRRLAAFQVKALRHALTFPSVHRIVYSTCSVHEEENERVIEAVLKSAQQKGFVLQRTLPSWPRRGHPLFQGCETMIRIDPEQDQSDGFFIAVFERHLPPSPSSNDLRHP